MTDGPVKAEGARKPGRPRYAKGASAQDTKEKLLKIAIALFSAHGYEAVSTGDIARKAELTQSMVHYHFSSKELLWKAAIHELMRIRGKHFPPPAAQLHGLAPVPRLRLLLRSVIVANAHNPEFVRMAIHEGTIASPRLTWLVQTYMKHGYELFDDAIRDGITEGSIPPFLLHNLSNTVTAVSLLFGMQQTLTELYGVDVTAPEQVESFVSTVDHVIFRGLLSDQPPAT